MRLSIEEAITPGQIAQFVQFPFSLYGRETPWVPNLKKDDIALLTPGRHPFWLTASRKLFMARRNGKIVGRIAAIIDSKYNSYADTQCGAFGFFECVNDKDVAHALLDQTSAWLGENGMRFMRGPLNPSANYSCGLLVSGFDHPPTLMMPWNHPWYPELLESWHMRKEQDLFAYVVRKDQVPLPKWLVDEVGHLKVSGKFTCRPSSKASLKEDVHSMLEIYRKSWADNWGFSPLSPQEASSLVKELTAILNPHFFVLFFHNNLPVAGMVALPDMNPLLKRLNGSLSIGAPLHYWRSRKDIRRGYRIMLFGILPEYRLYGLPLLLFDYLLEQARANPEFEWVEGSWVLEDNFAIDDLIEDFGGKLVKRYRIYRRDIGPC